MRGERFPARAWKCLRLGLIFVSFQADVDRQFVPIQKSLDELDLLNKWTTPIGSATFAVPSGCPDGGFIGQDLFI